MACNSLLDAGDALSFEFLDHTADTAVRLKSADPKELFRDATRALLAIFVASGEGSPVVPRASLPIRVEAEDGETLLVDYLNELVFLFDTKQFLALDLEASVVELEAPSRVEGTLKGETFDPARHVVKTEVKAATFHGMEIKKTKEGLEADVVFDL